jgi:hypothetical protein
MKIWMFGEIQSDIADGYGSARKEIEKAFNKNMAEKNFGQELVELAYIGIIKRIDSPEYGEIKKYTKRDRTAEFRLKIPYDFFLQANECERIKLVATSVLRTVSLARELKIKDFDCDVFEAEVIALCCQMGWIEHDVLN